MQDRGKYVCNASMATTILGRTMHRATMVEFEGRRYRIQEAVAPIVINADAS